MCAVPRTSIGPVLVRAMILRKLKHSLRRRVQPFFVALPSPIRDTRLSHDQAKSRLESPGQSSRAPSAASRSIANFPRSSREAVRGACGSLFRVRFPFVLRRRRAHCDKSLAFPPFHKSLREYLGDLPILDSDRRLSEAALDKCDKSLDRRAAGSLVDHASISAQSPASRFYSFTPNSSPK